MTTLAEKSLPIICGRIIQAYQPLKLILFGSQARGEAGPHSDIDLLVVLSQVEDKRQTTVAIRRLLSDLSVSKDILVTTPEEIEQRGQRLGRVLRPALRDGRVIYERT
jgi:uncharacterized protein